MTYAYIRVSTNHQDGDNQKLGIETFASGRNLHIDKYIDDSGQSGTVEPEKRELGDNIQSKVLAFAFRISAEIERTLISQRTKEP